MKILDVIEFHFRPCFVLDIAMERIRFLQVNADRRLRKVEKFSNRTSKKGSLVWQIPISSKVLRNSSRWRGHRREKLGGVDDVRKCDIYKVISNTYIYLKLLLEGESFLLSFCARWISIIYLIFKIISLYNERRCKGGKGNRCGFRSKIRSQVYTYTRVSYVGMKNPKALSTKRKRIYARRGCDIRVQRYRGAMSNL